MCICTSVYIYIYIYIYLFIHTYSSIAEESREGNDLSDSLRMKSPQDKHPD